MSRKELKNKRYYDEKQDLWVVSWNAVEKYFTPPTEQEVCEALSVWDNSVKWEYKPLTDENYECITDGKHHYFINDIDCNEVINCLPCPLYLFALIGRFYEGKAKE